MSYITNVLQHANEKVYSLRVTKRKMFGELQLILGILHLQSIENLNETKPKRSCILRMNLLRDIGSVVNAVTKNNIFQLSGHGTGLTSLS